jgi:S1-C subfamily serine protease/HEAT repeat protein
VFRFPTLQDDPPSKPTAQTVPIPPAKPPVTVARRDETRSPSSQELYVADKLPPEPARPIAPRRPTAEVVEDLEVVDRPTAAFADDDDDDDEPYEVVQPLPRREPRRTEPAGNGPAEKRPGTRKTKQNDNPLAAIPLWVFATAAGVLIGVPVFALTAFFLSRGSATPEVETAFADEAPLHRGLQRSKPPAPVVVAKKEKPAPVVVTKKEKPAPTVEPRRVLTTAEIVAECEPSIGQVLGQHKSGTGFLVRAGVLATNSHVIEGEKIGEIEVRFPSAPEPKRGPFKAKLLYQDPNRDVAFLTVETPLPPLRVAQSYKFLKGEDVAVIGSPGLGEGGGLKLENAVSRGVVSSRIELDGHEFLQLGISINHGNSGGPVLDSHGEVIGIATAIASKQEGLAFCVPVQAVRNALASIDDGTAGPPPTEIAQAPDRSEPEPAKPQKIGPPGRLKPGVKTAPALAYGWVPGEVYVYKFRAVYDFGEQSAVLEGTTLYRAKEVDDTAGTMTYGGWIIGRVRDQAGKLVDNTLNGPTAIEQSTLRVGRKGAVFSNDTKAHLPMLGNLSMFLIEPLPDGPQLAWSGSRKINVDSITRFQTPGSGGGGFSMPSLAERRGIGARSRPGSRSRSVGRRPSLRDRMQQQRATPATPGQEKVIIVSHPGRESTSYAVKSVTRTGVTIANRYQLATEETIEDQPQFSVEGEGTLTLDPATGLPTAYDYQARITEIDDNTTLRIPVTVQFRLLKGADRDLAIRAPVMPPTPMNPCSADDVANLLAKLKSGDQNASRDAAGSLLALAPLANRRQAVVKALEPLLKSSDGGVRSAAYRAIGVWGTSENVKIPLANLDAEQDGGVRDALFEAIGRLQPSPDSFGPLIAQLGKHPGAERALRAAGPAAESALLQTVVNDGAEMQTRIAACGLLRDLGSASSVSALESIAAMREGIEIGRAAADAVRQVEARFPDENALALLIADLSSPDGGRLNSALERLTLMEPIEARRSEVARALELATRVPDRGVQERGFRALGVWGDAESTKFLIDRLADPAFRTRREAIEAARALAPDDPRLAAAIGAGFEQDPHATMDALVGMGAAAEPELIKLLDRPEERRFNMKEIISRLGVIGTPACIPAIEKKKGNSKDIFLKKDADKAIAAIKARGGDDSRWLKTAIAELKSNDDGRRREAYRVLSTRPPTDGPNAAVSRGLQASLDDPDFFSRGALLKAIELWGDESIAGPLAKRAALPGYQGWETALVIVAKLRPDEPAVIDLICTRAVGERGDMATPALKLLGARAEPKLLAYAEGRGPKEERNLALRALGTIGTPASLDSLRKLAAFAAVEPLANSANDAVNAIKARQ